MAKRVGTVICKPEQVETVKGLLKRIPIYVFGVEPYQGKRDLVICKFAMYKHQVKKVQTLMGKLEDKTPHGAVEKTIKEVINEAV